MLVAGCMIILFGISELTGISLTKIFGIGILGPLGLGLLFLLLLFGTYCAFAVALLIKVLLETFISNRNKLTITLGIIGLCVILAGYLLAIKNIGWSLFAVIVGFSVGCIAGAEYQKSTDLKKE